MKAAGTDGSGRLDSEFIVAESEVLDEGVPSTDQLGRTKLFSPRIGRSRALSQP
jgi:hypothetical protein